VNIEQLPFAVPGDRSEDVQRVLEAARTAISELDVREQEALVGVRDLFQAIRTKAVGDAVALAESLVRTRH
jgi:hypothetical protein